MRQSQVHLAPETAHCQTQTNSVGHILDNVLLCEMPLDVVQDEIAPRETRRKTVRLTEDHNT
jgi:hypothetical protein